MGFDTIYEDLKWFDDSLVVDGLDLRRTVAEVLSELPEDMQDFVLDDVWWFTISPQNYALAFPISIPVGHVPDDKQITRRVIILSPSLSEASREQAMFTIAHEIAHSWLKHGDVKTKEEFDAQETEADAQAAEWGFPRPQKKPE